MSKARRIASCLELAAGCARDAALLAAAGSRNAAYLASHAAEHVITAIATSEDIHIERHEAHQLDTIVRKVPHNNPDRGTLETISFLEAYATSYRNGTPTGRLPEPPSQERIETAQRDDQRSDRLAAPTLRRAIGRGRDRIANGPKSVMA